MDLAAAVAILTGGASGFGAAPCSSVALDRCVVASVTAVPASSSRALNSSNWIRAALRRSCSMLSSAIIRRTVLAKNTITRLYGEEDQH